MTKKEFEKHEIECIKNIFRGDRGEFLWTPFGAPVVPVSGPGGAPIALLRTYVVKYEFTLCIQNRNEFFLIFYPMKKDEYSILFQFIYIALNILIKLTFHSGKFKELEKLID